jgi:hypothetical protein
MLPKNLRYGNKVESAAAKSYRTNIQPQNGTGTYQMGDTITVNIPTRANLVLATTESYLKFTSTYTSTINANALRLDSCGAHGLISRIRVWHGSNLLQDIAEYGLLAKMLLDLQVPSDAVYGKLNVTTGTRNDLIAITPTYTNAADNVVATINTAVSALSAQPISCLQINSGELISAALANNGTASVTYALNLISLVGSLCSQQYFPLFACTSAPLRVEITLQDNANKAYVQALEGSNFVLSNVEYVANFIELSDAAMGMIQQSLQGSPLQFVVPDYRNYQYSFALANGSASQVSMPIPAKFSSLKSLFVTCRPRGTGTLTYFPYSCNVNGITDYTFRVGSQIMPTKAPNNIQEQFMEVIKAIGSVSDLNHHPSIEKTSYSLNASTAMTAVNNATVNSGSFYIGLDLESYANANKDSIFAGYNSNTDDIFAVINVGANAITSTARFDAFALFDCVVVLENNTAYCRY